MAPCYPHNEPSEAKELFLEKNGKKTKKDDKRFVICRKSKEVVKMFLKTTNKTFFFAFIYTVQYVG